VEEVMGALEFLEENCENCAFLAADDSCGNRESVYYRRPTVYRDGEAVLQTGWCEQWMRQNGAAPLQSQH
jgi:hypothetical protein